MVTNFIKILQEAGLKESEAAVYSILLKSQKMTVSEIARATGIKRPTCYQHLDSLLIKDFVIRIPLGKRMYYGAACPKKILASAKKRFSVFETAVEEMTRQHEESTNKPKVVFTKVSASLKIFTKIYSKLSATSIQFFHQPPFLKTLPSKITTNSTPRSVSMPLKAKI